MGYAKVSLLSILLASAAPTPHASAVLVVRVGDRLRVLDEAPKVLRALQFTLRDYDRFSVNRGASVAVGLRGRCDTNGGGDLYVLQGVDKAKKLTWPRHLVPGPFGKDETEVYADPALSPSGRLLAFVARPCNAKREYDLVEAAGVVVIFDQAKGGIRVLRGTSSEAGVPIGFANNPTWSADEKLLYVNFETGFRVLRSADGTVVAEYPINVSGDSWSNAVGWIGSRCVVFAEGKDFREADQNPLLVFNIEKKEWKRLDALSEGIAVRISGVVSLQWPFVVSRESGQLALTRLGHNGFTARYLSGVDQAVLISREDNDLPQFCRP